MSAVIIPETMDALWQSIGDNPGALLYAGGTDLLVKLRGVPSPPPSLICMERIRELRRVEERGNAVFVGACATHASLLQNPLLADSFPVLSGALKNLGSPPIRNMGTIGGNICTASPAADTLPALYVLDAEVEILAQETTRRVRASDFILAPGRTSLQSGEVVSGIWLKKSPSYNIHHFEKVGQRNALAIAIVSMAAVLEVSGSGVIERARLAWGSVGPTVVTSSLVEEALLGQPLTLKTLRRAGEVAADVVNPIDDIRGSASYRRRVAGNLLLRLAEKQTSR